MQSDAVEWQLPVTRVTRRRRGLWQGGGTAEYRDGKQGVCIKIIDAVDRDGVTARMFQGKDLGSGHTQIRKKAQYDVV